MIIKPDQQGAYESFLDLDDSNSETASTGDRLAESGDLPAYTQKAHPAPQPLEAPPSYETGDSSRGGHPNLTGPSAASHQEDQAQRNLRALHAPANTEASPSRLSASSERTAETRPSQVRSALGPDSEAPTQSGLLRRLQSLTQKAKAKEKAPATTAPQPPLVNRKGKGKLPIGKPQPLDTLDTRLNADAFTNPRTPPRPPGFIDPFILRPLSDGSSANESSIDQKRRELGGNTPQQAPISSQGSENTQEALTLQTPPSSQTEPPPPYYYVTNPDSRPASPTSPNPAADRPPSDDHSSLKKDGSRNPRPAPKLTNAPKE